MHRRDNTQIQNDGSLKLIVLWFRPYGLIFHYLYSSQMESYMWPTFFLLSTLLLERQWDFTSICRTATKWRKRPIYKGFLLFRESTYKSGFSFLQSKF